MAHVIDLNADMGESFGSWTMGADSDLLKVVSSANIACGFHAGDPLVMMTTCQDAAKHGVSVGAHVSYRDLAGFGRNFIDIEPARLKAEVLYQICAIDGVARSVGSRVGYVKPHGALYNTIVHHEGQARAVIEAIETFNATAHPLALLGLPGSLALQLADERGIRTVREAFADRAYTADGTLVSRREKGSVLHDAGAVAERMVKLATTGTITAITGERVAIDAESICVHGDSPGAAAMAASVKTALVDAGITIKAFC